MKRILLAVISAFLFGCVGNWECFSDSDCPQPLCPEVISKCDFGRCVTVYQNGTLANCTNISISNPAAKHCINRGYQYKIETDEYGAQRGYCYVNQSSYPGYTYRCDEWEFYRGECPTCRNFCEGLPHIMCVGYWNTSGEFPNCRCQYVCSNSVVCSSNSDCPSGYVCYNSRFCSTTPSGVVCGNQEGDLLCHKECEVNTDCPLDMPYCRLVSMAQGDVVSAQRMCMREECKINSDCPQPRCPGVRNICVNGECKLVDSSGNSARCDLPEMNRELCEKYGGHWNECGSACTGEPPGTVCIAVCIAQCECGGIAGWSCPPGYYCKLSGGIPDELGVCKPS
ncbi:MAG: DUF333 domain-containing protein [Candidatus Micrarchaeia archaeon]